jgi:1,2-diacylglycerol 3-beta-glucosyltransferase
MHEVGLGVARIALSVPDLLVGAMVAAVALYLLTISVAALFPPSPKSGPTPTTRLAVLIPAHDEALSIASCVRSLLAQDYPRELYRIVVIADNCSDETAALARMAGAQQVMTRIDPEAHGKGRALRWALDQLLSAAPEDEAIVILDADSTANPDFLQAIARHFEAGASVVQGEGILLGDKPPATALRVAAFLLTNRVRPAGRAALGLPAAHLSGTGMLLSRRVLLEHPWEAFTSAEDVEYSIELRVAGVDITFAPEAKVSSPAAPNPRAAAQQQLRWEGGQAHLTRKWLPWLVIEGVRARRPRLLAIAFDLAMPPLGTLAAAALAGGLVTAGLSAVGALPWWTLAPWLIALSAIPASVLIGLRAGHCARAGYRALVRAPLLILGKVLRAPAVMRFRGDSWVRTERHSDLG